MCSFQTPVEPTPKSTQRKSCARRSKKSLDVKPRKSKRLCDGQVTLVRDVCTKGSKETESSKTDDTHESKDKSHTPPTASSFNFRCETELPSDPIQSVTLYQVTGSPHSTPTKRFKSSTGQSTACKRKRKNDAMLIPDVTPETPTPLISPLVQTYSKKNACRKLSLSPDLKARKNADTKVSSSTVFVADPVHCLIHRFSYTLVRAIVPNTYNFCSYMY